MEVCWSYDMYTLVKYDLYPLRLLRIFIKACCLILVEDVASISWIYALFACFVALIEIRRYIVCTLEDVKLIRYIWLFCAKENCIDKIHTCRVWYIHRKWIGKCLQFIFKRYIVFRHIHLKWIQELFHIWLCSIAHERLQLYEIYVWLTW